MVIDQALAPAKSNIISNKPKNIVEFSQVESQMLYTVKSIFPFNPFPTTVSVRPTSISIVHSLFGLSENVMTISISDIFTVEVDSGFLFATIKFQQKQAHLQEIDVTYVWKAHAFKLRRIVQGLMIVENKNLEIPEMKPEQLIQYLEEIGGTKARQ